mmetsp:Transcript_23169/g.50770  ORF Transcript_23169/g.50770 Transcript_23169/m.50770 type:complete len:267 (-) Transcript_23169:705-1505(-)
MGGRAHAFFSVVVDTSSTSADIPSSVCPGNRRIFHTRQLSAALYFAFPEDTWMVARAVCFGTGTRTTTPMAKSLTGKVDLILTLHSMRVRPCSLMMGSTRKGRWMPSVMRYFISSNSPSGGTKLTHRSVWKRLRLTHWWKVTSSSSMSLLPVLLVPPSLSRVSLSFSPSFRSGMPERKHFIISFPEQSDRSTVPLADISRFTLSMMSRYTSFFLYRMPSRRCPTAPVTCRVARLSTGSFALSMKDLTLDWVMYNFRMSGDKICGYP